jgi:hypothetical protein
MRPKLLYFKIEISNLQNDKNMGTKTVIHIVKLLTYE